jgi:hypothetical protein
MYFCFAYKPPLLWEGDRVVAEDGASVAQREGGAEEGLEGEGGTVVAEDGASVAQREGGAEEGLEGEDGTVVAEDGASIAQREGGAMMVITLVHNTCIRCTCMHASHALAYPTNKKSIRLLIVRSVS